MGKLRILLGRVRESFVERGAIGVGVLQDE